MFARSFRTSLLALALGVLGALGEEAEEGAADIGVDSALEMQRRSDRVIAAVPEATACAPMRESK